MGQIYPDEVGQSYIGANKNAKLKRMYADLALENAAIKDVLNRNL